jgi:hypothetical protein
LGHPESRQLGEFAGNPLHRQIIERFSLWNYGKWIAGQWPFSENIDKRKWDLHCDLCSKFNLERWGFDVLVSLRRAGKPYRLTPTQLYNSLMLTSGAMTNRVDRLEAAGLVKRLHDPADRRGVLVSLTKDGLS